MLDITQSKLLCTTCRYAIPPQNKSSPPVANIFHIVVRSPLKLKRLRSPKNLYTVTHKKILVGHKEINRKTLECFRPRVPLGNYSLRTRPYRSLVRNLLKPNGQEELEHFKDFNVILARAISSQRGRTGKDSVRKGYSRLSGRCMSFIHVPLSAPADGVMPILDQFDCNEPHQVNPNSRSSRGNVHDRLHDYAIRLDKISSAIPDYRFTDLQKSVVLQIYFRNLQLAKMLGKKSSGATHMRGVKRKPFYEGGGA
jgi:hypothetical protein